jgi:TonB family protein
MFTPSKLPIFIALFCVSGMGQVSPSVSQQAAPASAGAASTAENSPEPKPAEYTLDPIETSKAIYPTAAKEQKIQGRVVGNMLVSETGGVESVHFFRSNPVLASAAEEAAKKWKFKPVMKGGQPMAVVARVTFNFVLADDVQETKDVAADLDQITGFPQRIRVSSAVTQGLLLHKVDPSYPEEARKARVQGAVLMKARISKEGRIVDLQVVSGPEALVPSAMEAARQWQYKPYLLLGRPVEVDTQIQANFTLSYR